MGERSTRRGASGGHDENRRGAGRGRSGAPGRRQEQHGRRSGRGGHHEGGRGQGQGRRSFKQDGPQAGASARPAGGRSGSARQVALEVLTRVRRDDAFANLLLPELLETADLDRRDAGFATALTYGTLRLLGRYDAMIAACTDRPLERIDPAVLDVLRLGAHQLMGMRVAQHAAVSTTVDLATTSCGRGAATFVNAVMRRLSGRDLDSWMDELRRDAPDETSALARTQSHPEWIVKALRQALVTHGRSGEELEVLLAADNADPEVALCARPGLIAPEALAKAARKADRAHDVEPRPGRISPLAVVMVGGDPGRIDAIRDCRAGVEDEGSQLVALVAAHAPVEGRDERWLDLCAGPGGKAALLAARAAQTGAQLLANEASPHRADLVRSALRAIAPDVARVRCGDGRDLGRDEPGAYDRVLVDAPCTGLGSLRRRPEARWRRQPGDVTVLAELQRELLASALRAVRRGGVVTYVTCSPHALETTLVVRDVTRLLEREGLRTEPLHAGDVATRLAPHPPAGSDRAALQLWPHLDGTDAMFCALLRRTS